MSDAAQLIGGRWSEPAATPDAIDPSDGVACARIGRGGAREIDAAVRAAQAALDGPWGGLTATERLLSRLAALIARDAERLAGLESRDVGKPIRQARADAAACARYVEFCGGAADKVMGDTIPYQDGFTVFTLREPHGVTAHIVPSNYPLQIAGRSVAAALAIGNACVLKPAEDASLTCLAIARPAEEAGFPPGALNVVTGLGEEAGAALSSHPGIGHVSFTGSPEVGRLIQSAAARNTIPVTLELGPAINAAQKSRIEGSLAQAGGLRIAGRGSIASNAPPGGHDLRPALLADVPPDHGLAQEEVFGPVLVAIRVKDEEALRVANGTACGLVSGVWTGDAGRAMRLARRIRTGQVFVNNYGAGGGVELPFGGMKGSGHGREKGFAARYGFATMKTVAVKHG